jgi:hypothetical protein
MPILVFLLRKKSSQPLCCVFHPQHGRKQAPIMKVIHFYIHNSLNVNNIHGFFNRRVAVARVVGGKYRTTARQNCWLEEKLTTSENSPKLNNEFFKKGYWTPIRP